MTDKIVVLTACETAEQAESVASHLVESRLAACVNVSSPVKSIYRWQGKVESADEWLLTIKTRRALFPRVQEAIRKIHSYQTPEVIALPIVDGSDDYLEWIDREVTD
ncbi:MAG: divalent-cation tolerance protein CutA [Bryobacteraceae bacterium]